ncbi:MAG: hypothetical protein GFH25_541324n16 [Chloroflexi bacterium AL-N10]|nr:hypothetical protein [Chloroflexi bacterium AL-N10]
MNDSEDTKYDGLVDASLDSIGGITGTAIGFTLAGPVGAFVGAAAGPYVPVLVRKVASEFQRHVLGQREERRIASVLELTVRRINSNLEQGYIVRQDDFFHLGEDDRSVAEEILEGVLIATQRDHEEKKVRYYANLFANIAFREDIDRGLANAILDLVEGWSYRKLVALAYFTRDDHCRPHFRFGDEQSVTRLSLGADVYSMGRQGVLILEDNNSYSIDVEIYGITEFGKVVAELMDLSDLDVSDVEEVGDILAQNIGRWVKNRSK